ncbi:MAG TPA: methylamine utilization protein [Woeseiaceae bacterium]|nr:methylamine utilization protein [Woeseiaceae bacterium]
MQSWQAFRHLAAALWLLLPLAGLADKTVVEVSVVDRDANPVPGVAAYWRPADGQRHTAPSGTTAVMDQVDTRFVPHLLVVQTGTSVQFPNSDTVAHHVYSFSHPNQFKLPIYKGDAHPPVTFTESGIVILGCNIHDNMLGYILVVDTPAFGVTDESGKVSLSAGMDAGEVVIWSPRIRDGEETLAKASVPASVGSVQIDFRLAKALRPAFDEKTEALAWSDY